MTVKTSKDNPAVVIWETTRACRLACRHCRAETRAARDPRELSTEEGFRLIDQAAELGKPRLVLTGGDPMQREDVVDLVRRAAARRLETTLSLSAAQRITADKLSALKRARVRRVAVGVDSFEAARHDGFRGVVGSFDQTMQIAREVRLSDIPLQIGTIIGKQNKDELSALAGLVKTLGAELWSLSFLVPAGRAEADDLLSPSEYRVLLNELYDISKRSRFAVATSEAPQYRRVAAQRAGRKAPARAAGEEQAVVFIGHTGEVYPNACLPLSAGNVRSQPLPDIYRQSPLFRALRDPNALQGTCGSCDYRRICGGSRARAYALTGNLLAPDPLCPWSADGAAVVRAAV